MNYNTKTPTKLEAIAHTVRQPFTSSFDLIPQNIEETQVPFVHIALLLLLDRR